MDIVKFYKQPAPSSGQNKKKYMGKYKKTKSSNFTLLKKLSKEYFPVQVWFHQE